MFRGSLLGLFVLFACVLWLASASMDEQSNRRRARNERGASPASKVLNRPGTLPADVVPDGGAATVEPTAAEDLRVETAVVTDPVPQSAPANPQLVDSPAAFDDVCTLDQSPGYLASVLAPANRPADAVSVAEGPIAQSDLVLPEVSNTQTSQSEPPEAVSTLADQPPVVESSEPPLQAKPAIAAVAEFTEPETAGQNEDEEHEVPVQLVVHSDYRKAMKEAAEDRKMLFIYFHERRATAAQRAFERETLADIEIQEKLKRYVFVRLPRDAEITVDGNRIALLKHAAFAEMLGRQGVAVIDLAHVGAEYYGHVVSTFPFTPGKYYRKQALSIILDLPTGTLTQRTMIYAVRIHPERPASTQGQFNAVLADEANQHANHQAAILLQGHHSWDSRFHRINARLPSGVMAQEVVAESWPNESLVEACIDCVHSWRQSPGHWGAVRSRQPLFGYDIKRGRNGIWYATGIFGRR